MNRLPDRKKVIRHAVDTNIDTTQIISKNIQPISNKCSIS